MAGLERLGLLAAASLTLVFALFVVRDDTRPAADRVGWLPGHLPAFAYVTVGVVVVSRRPGNIIGWLCCGIGLAQILAGFGGSSAGSVLAADPSYRPGWVVLYELGELCWELSWALLAVLLLVFPTGRLPSRRWRPVAWGLVPCLCWRHCRVCCCLAHRPMACGPTRSRSQRWRACSGWPITWRVRSCLG